MGNSIRELARRLSGLERQVKTISQPRLGYSSFEGGEAIEQYDGDTPVQRIGTQWDGTHVAATLTGPTPPTPSQPTVTPTVGGLIVAWDGVFADSPLTVAPMDFAGVDVVVSGASVPDFIATPPVHRFVSPRGGEVFVSLPESEFQVSLVTRSTSGKASVPAAPEIGTPLPVPSGGGPGDPTEPPAASPTIKVKGFAESLVVQAESVDTSTSIIYEIAPDVAGVPGTWEQIGDPTKALIQVIPNLPVTGTRLEQDKTYHVRATATNGINPNPAPSPSVSASLDTTAVEDIFIATLTAGFLMAGEIRVGTITINPDTGITVPQPNGKTIHLPTDGSRARLEGAGVDAAELTVAGQSTFQGLIALSNRLTMNASVQPPKTAPGVINDYPSLTIGPINAQDTFINWYGLCDSIDGTKWISVTYAASAYYVVGVDKVTGAVTYLTGLSAFGVVDSITRIGTRYWIAHDSKLSSFDANWVQQGSSINVPVEDSGYRDAVGFAGADVLHGRKLLNGNLRIRRYTAAGALVSTHTVTAANSGGDLPPMGNVLNGAHGYASSMYTVPKSGTGDIRVIDDVTLEASTTLSFPPAGSVEQKGLWWDGTRFWGLGKNGKIYQYSRFTQDYITVQASQTLTDGTAETAESPKSGDLLRRKRAWLKVTTSSPPTSPAGLFGRVYISDRWSSDPQSARYRQAPTPALSNTNSSGFVELLDKVTVAPTAQIGNFASGGIGELRTGSGGFLVDGSSNGSVGTGTFRDSVRSTFQGPARNMTEGPGNYATGVTHFNAGSAPDGGADYPAGAFSSVITYKGETTRTIQYNFAKNGDKVYLRGVGDDNVSWTAWRDLGVGNQQPVVTKHVNVTTNSNGEVTLNHGLNLPTGEVPYACQAVVISHLGSPSVCLSPDTMYTNTTCTVTVYALSNAARITNANRSILLTSVVKPPG